MDPNTNWIWVLVIGGLVGWLAGLLTRGQGFGIVGNIVFGIIGALIGGLVFTMLGLSTHGTFGALLVSTIGAVVLLLIARVAFPRRVV
jgi:uncharacterized membrane protein YeaQ/YmgE (transglycosylase-associated protein family)